MRVVHILLPVLALLLVPYAAAQLPGSAGGGLPLGQTRALPIDQAFPFFVAIVDDKTLSVTFQPAPEHYLYQHRFAFSLRTDAGPQEVLTFMLPDGLEKHDQFFGDIVAYYGDVTAKLPLATSDLGGKALIIEFQGCADWGLCYPPQVVEYPFLP